MEKSKKSSGKSIVLIIISIIAILVCLVDIFCVKPEGTKLAWRSSLEVILIILFGGLLIWNIINLVRNKRISKLQKNMPYNFDYQKELSTYTIIGKDNKKTKNGAMKFSKYSEWKQYILANYAEQMKNDDFYRFLKRELRKKKDYVNLLITVVTPIEITILSASIAIFQEYSVICIAILSFYLITFLTIDFCRARDEVNFLEDYIEILLEKRNGDIGI